MATQLIFCQFCSSTINQSEIKKHGNNICNKNKLNVYKFNISDNLSSIIENNQSIKDKQKLKNAVPMGNYSELDKLLNCKEMAETKYEEGFFKNKNEKFSNENNIQNNNNDRKKFNTPFIQDINFKNISSSQNENNNNNNKFDPSSTFEAAPPIMLIAQDQKNKIVDNKLFEDLTEIQIRNPNKLSTDKRKCKLCNVIFKFDEKAILLPCSHIFHIDHLKNWFKKHQNCPTCSMKISSSTINTPK